MNTPNEDGKRSDNMELLKQQASACGSGCDCHATTMPGKMRWVIGTIVLFAAGVMVVRALVKSEGASAQPSATAFADPVASMAAATAPAKDSGTATPAVETSVVTPIGAFTELNTAAEKMNAVFAYLPGKEGASGNPPFAVMKSAASVIETQGVKCGLFTLKAGSADYDKISTQVKLPVVLAIVKGGGMSTVSTSDITETKLVQGFLAASKSGGCGPSAGSGCCPK